MNQEKIAPAIRIAEAACSFMCTTEEHAKAVAALADEAIRLYSNIVEMEDLNISRLAKIESLNKELTAEAARTANEKLRADQMTEQHRMQCNISKNAVATLVGLGYTDQGGEQWTPPIGKAPDFSLLDAAYARGWYACTGWAKRPGLASDIGSPAYVQERERLLNQSADRPARECLQQSTCSSVYPPLPMSKACHAADGQSACWDADEMRAYVDADRAAYAAAATTLARPAPAAVAVPAATALAEGALDSAFQHLHWGNTSEAMKSVIQARAALAAAMAPECGNCFEGKSDLDHTCRKCSGSGIAPAQAVAMPQGWKLVPINDTPAMWTAGGRAIKSCGGHERDAASLAYKAMVDAAPAAPAQEHATQLAGQGREAQAVQWRNIKKAVRALADFCFGSKDDPQWGIAHIAIVNSLTAKDGLDVSALGLEPLPAAAPAQAHKDEQS